VFKQPIQHRPRGEGKGERKVKYLIIETWTTTTAVLFGGTISHKEMAQMLESEFVKVVGAGICSFNWSPEECDWLVSLLAGSESLGMDKKDEDKFYIRSALNN
jgi:hypothetical protein